MIQAPFLTAREERSRDVRQHLGHLDALRGIAVLGVLLIHTGQWSPTRYDAATFNGQRGVQLFFIVSAFTLMLSGDNRKAEPHATLAFFLRRFFRLAPMYYICIVLAPLLLPIFQGSWRQPVLAALFLHNLSPRWYWAGTPGGWSLGNEALFYACVPMLHRFVRSFRASISLFIGSSVVSLAISRFMLVHDPAHYDYWLFYSYLTEAPIFFMGIMVYFAWKEHMRSLQGTALAKSLSMLLLLAAVAVLVAAQPLNQLALLASSAWCALLLAALSLHPWSFFVNRFTIFMGKISYSVYLLHFFFLWWVLPWFRTGHPWAQVDARHQLTHFSGTYLATLAASIAVSTLTWLYVEEPGIRLGSWVIRRIQGRGNSKPGTPSGIPNLLSTQDTPETQF